MEILQDMRPILNATRIAAHSLGLGEKSPKIPKCAPLMDGSFVFSHGMKQRSKNNEEIKHDPNLEVQPVGRG